MANGIVWMRVALHAVHGEPVQNGPRRRNTVHRRDQPELFVVGSTFLVVGSLAVKRRRDAVLKRRVRKQIAG